MKTPFVSIRTAVTLSCLAYLTGLARMIMEVRFIPEIVNAMSENHLGQTSLIILLFVVLFGGWLWALLSASHSRRGGMIGMLVFDLILALPWGLATVVAYCPSPCAVAWPLQEIITWLNVTTGLLAAGAVGLALHSKLPILA